MLTEQTEPNASWCDKLAGELEIWRDALPKAYQWSDCDGPSSDIHAARMRAKYHLAQYIIHLHFLNQLLYPQIAHGEQYSIHRTTTSKCELCVKSAIQYTAAFVRLVKPRILENKFSIAHAYVSYVPTLACADVFYRWFNILHALSLTYRAEFTHLISQEVLEKLFQKTINFPNDFHFNSPARAEEARFLQNEQKSLFPGANT